MTRIDFYVLSSDNDNARLSFACRLTEKVFNMGQRIYVHSANPSMSAKLDDMLWTFKAGAFVPHAKLDAAQGEPVVIGDTGESHADDWDVMINLAAEVPEFFSRYHRVAEVVDKDGQRRSAGRERFRFYRERGYELHTHNV